MELMTYSYTPLVTTILLSLIVTSSVLYRYGNWFRHHIIVTLTVLLAWYFSFLIVFALPLDVIATVFRQCLEKSNVTEQNNRTNCEEPWSLVPDHVFPNLWHTVYWSTQCLTWLIMPMMQSYIKAGDFSVKGKLKSALIDNAIYYGSYLFICGILLIYLALRPDVDLTFPRLKAIASSASNTWGLFLLVLLLGYSLVEQPRNLYLASNRIHTLTRAYFRAAVLSSEKCEAEETVDDVLESLQAVSLAVRPGHPLHRHLETILQKVPVELRERMSRRRVDDEAVVDTASEKALVRLHKQVIKALQVLQRTETQWNLLVEEVLELEDVLRNMGSREKVFKGSFTVKKSGFVRIFYGSKLEWYWKCVFYGYVLKILGLIAGVLSVVVVWSEVTFFNKNPPLSIFAILVNVAKKNYDYFSIGLLSTIVILYLCYCAYSTVLKIRILNIYYLAPHHQTNEYSLIFSGMMLSRLTPAICLNFLGLIHMDSHIIKDQLLETYYTQIMGHMDVIAIISDGFNVYFPMAILAFCLATYFSLGSRFLSMLGFHQFIGDNEITTDLVDEGKELIKREKRRRQRAEETQMRRQEYQDRFSTTMRPYRSRNTDTIRATSRLRGDAPEPTAYDGSGGDSSHHPDAINDIESRFGPSTRPAIGDRYADDHELETRFADSYQHDDGGERRYHHRHQPAMPPRGIFDDV